MALISDQEIAADNGHVADTYPSYLEQVGIRLSF